MIELCSADELRLRSAAIGVQKKPLRARGVQIVEEMLKLAVNVDRRERRVLPAGYISGWPEITRTIEEEREAWLQRAAEMDEARARGVDYADVIGVSNRPGSAELGYLGTVDRCFRDALRGYAKEVAREGNPRRDPDVDFKMLWRLAEGIPQRTVAKEYGLTQPRLAAIKKTRTATIFHDLIEPLIEPPKKNGSAGYLEMSSTGFTSTNYTEDFDHADCGRRVPPKSN
jgi:hypothetical protein